MAQRPEAGAIIPGTGGLRKTRLQGAGRGKRGGIRLIYFWHARSATLLMLFSLGKNERADLTMAQKERLRRIVETEYL